MRPFVILLMPLFAILLTIVTGCQNVEFAYPVRIGTDVFGFEPKWADKKVVFVTVLIKDPNSKEKVELPAIAGPCSGNSIEDIKNLPPFKVVWAVQAINPVPATSLVLRPGEVPDGFEQAIPPPGEKFIPVAGTDYFILTCLDPVDDRFYSIGIKWSPGQEPASLGRVKVIIAEDVYRQKSSGMEFPLKAGDFIREVIRQYDTEGLDISAGYNLKNPFRPVAATVYVYPVRIKPEIVKSSDANGLTKIEIEGVKQAILQMHKGANIVSEDTVLIKQSNANYSGRTATFDYEDIFAGMKQPVRSQLYIFCHPSKKWLVKYRFTYPQSVNASEDIRNFMEILCWTIDDSQ